MGFEKQCSVSRQQKERFRKRRVALFKKATTMLEDGTEIYIVLRRKTKHYTYTSNRDPSWPPQPLDLVNSRQVSFAHSLTLLSFRAQHKPLSHQILNVLTIHTLRPHRRTKRAEHRRHTLRIPVVLYPLLRICRRNYRTTAILDKFPDKSPGRIPLIQIYQLSCQISLREISVLEEAGSIP